MEPIREIVIRVRPGTTAAFEERAVARLRAAAPDWTFQAEPLPKSRETAHLFWLAPLAAAGIVSVFLLIMVAMGLTGVLWLHVTQRTREIGLRRAKGATVVNIRRQLVGEVVVAHGRRHARRRRHRRAVPDSRGVRRREPGCLRVEHRDFAGLHLRADDGLRVDARARGEQHRAGGGAEIRVGAGARG